VAALLLALGVASSEGCWRAIEPSAFASTCPIVVSGTIARIDPYAGDAERGHDIAYIAIHQILKNDLNDEPLRVGGHVKAKMCSTRNRVRVSTDIRYELGTGGIWLITMAKDGSLHIDQHPVQRQPQDKPFVMRELVSVTRDGTIIGRYTKKEWLERGDSADKKTSATPARPATR
jgi:hypothetical protein